MYCATSYSETSWSVHCSTQCCIERYENNSDDLILDKSFEFRLSDCDCEFLTLLTMSSRMLFDRVGNLNL